MSENQELAGGEKLSIIIEALKEKQGENIVIIDLQDVGHAICDYFVICNADSSTQVDALAEAVSRSVKKALKENPHHIEGKDNSLWVLVDYADILVHVFQTEQRAFYNLEDLWAEGKLEKVVDAK